MRWPWQVPALALLLLVHITAASQGDRSLAFKGCLGLCKITQCASRAPSEYSKTQPWVRRWTHWSCEDDCSYACQQEVTDKALANEKQQGLPKGRMVQFYGKWPFRRFLGMQEPVSVLFSMMNLWAHWRWLGRMRRMTPSLAPSLRQAYKWMPVVGVNTWVWSILYHTRDYAWTERMDYFSAALSTLFWLYHAVLRISGIYEDQGPAAKRNGRLRLVLQALFVSAFVAHCTYLTFWSFDYGYNMAFNLLVGLSHNLAWYIWAAVLHSRAKPTPKHVNQHVITLTLFASLILLEVLDFQPWFRAVDAHALWHLGTVPIIGWFYDFHWDDAHYLAELHQQRQR